jgi:hypothetical protein
MGRDDQREPHGSGCLPAARLPGLVEIRPGAIDRARGVEPTIPEIGPNGIPMHDEIVLERCLG